MSDSKKDFELKDLFAEIPAEFASLFDNGSELRPWNFLGEILKKRVEALVLEKIKEAKNHSEFTQNINNKVDVSGEVWIHKSAVIEPWVKITGPVVIEKGVVIKSFSYIDGPALIGENSEVRKGAYIRGFVMTGRDCVIGHNTEVIRSLLFNHVRADHFNYIGDSILGNSVHLGAHATIANLKLNEKAVVLKTDLGNNLAFETGLKKFGGILGDNCQLGCSAVVGPGVIFTPGTWYYLPSPTEGIFSKEDFKK